MDADTSSLFLPAWISGYTSRCDQEQAESNQLNYFSCQPACQARDQSDFSQLRDDIDQFFEIFNPSVSNKGAATAEPEPIFTGTTPLQGIATCAHPPIFRMAGLSQLHEQNAKTHMDVAPLRLVTEFAMNTARRTSLHDGQIIPADSPSLPVEEGGTKISTPKNERDDCHITINQDAKSKTVRKKRKRVNKEDKEGMRKSFLERNRIAASKCRQNKIKWVDDLQTTFHILRGENMAKTVEHEDVKQEILLLKSLLSIHSESCTNKGIIAWNEPEGDRVYPISGAHSKQPSNEILLGLSRASPNPSPLTNRLSSSHNDGISTLCRDVIV